MRAKGKTGREREREIDKVKYNERLEDAHQDRALATFELWSNILLSLSSLRNQPSGEKSAKVDKKEEASQSFIQILNLSYSLWIEEPVLVFLF